MNERDRAELAALKLKQHQLERDLHSISSQLKGLEQRLQAADAKPGLSLEPATAATPRREQATAANPPGYVLPRTPPPLSPVISREPAGVPPPPGAAPEQPAPPTTWPLADSSNAPVPVSTNSGSSLELRLGTYWAPRVGIVVLLTGLVFLGNLAYQSLGPIGRVMLLYLASGILLGAGWWWQRKAVGSALRNYAQVLFAGGLAALYFTTYAAHHLETLRVISSPLVDGALLLICAGFIVWTAEHWKSEVLALFGAGLGDDTCIITRVGSFTLYSNLILTVAAVWFLVRNRWATLTFASALASYGAYAFWRFFNGTEWHWAAPAEGLWAGLCTWRAIGLCSRRAFSSRATRNSPGKTAQHF